VTRRIWIPLAVVLGVLGVGAAGLWAVWRLAQPKIRDRIIAEARIRGFDLDMEEYSLGREHLVLQHATVRPLEVHGLAARMDTVTLTLAGISWRTFFGRTEDVQLTGLEIDGADVHLLGSAPALALELARWSEHYPTAYDLPARATGVALGWRATSEEPPWLLIAQGRVTREPDGGQFLAEAASVGGHRVGPVGSSWSKQDGRLLMGFGHVVPSEAPVQMEVSLNAPEPTARVELRSTPLSALAGALGITLPLDESAQQRIQVKAQAQLSLPPSLAPTPVPGTLQVELLGFLPPHPPELQGIVSGDRTTFDTHFEVSADQSTVVLTETRVAAGAFALKGDGLVQRSGGHARVQLRLSESLRCTTLAGAAADSRLGRHWASLTRQLLQQYLQGSVRVMVTIEADTRNLSAARVIQNIGVGCGLQPLRPPTKEELEAFSKQLPGLISELPQLPGFPASTQKLPQGLPSLPTGLPSLPTALPTLPRQLPPPGSLPRLPLQEVNVQEANEAPDGGD
jgi:ADP-dependent NAD(P)H-hydrate dehydratase / NAD(P)H-hydrate epimerase